MTILTGAPLNWAVTATAGSGFLLSVPRSLPIADTHLLILKHRFGYDQGVMSGLLTGASFTSQFPEIDTTDGGNGSSSLQGTV